MWTIKVTDESPLYAGEHFGIPVAKLDVECSRDNLDKLLASIAQVWRNHRFDISRVVQKHETLTINAVGPNRKGWDSLKELQ